MGESAELAKFISYPTSASETTVLLKRPQNIDNEHKIETQTTSKITRTFTIFVEHGINAHIQVMTKLVEFLNGIIQ